MSNPIETSPTTIGEFQPRPAAPSAASDLVAECKRLEKRCAEAIAERDQMRAELAKTQAERDQYLKSLYHYMRKEAPPPDFTREEVFAHLGYRPTLVEIIADLEKTA